MAPVFFAKQADFRKWLEKNHKKETLLMVGFYKVNSGKPSMTWSQAVDEALCFGWIDGVRKSIDGERYQIRFTPRRHASTWSAVNIQKIEKLTQQGLMRQAGIEIFENRKENKSRIYTYENAEIKISSDLEKLFKANGKAWAYFQSLAPSFKKLSANWVMTARQETTRIKRLNELIKDSEVGINKWKDNKYSKKYR